MVALNLLSRISPSYQKHHHLMIEQLVQVLSIITQFYLMLKIIISFAGAIIGISVGASIAVIVLIGALAVGVVVLIQVKNAKVAGKEATLHYLF